jgi:hypothetical protein
MQWHARSRRIVIAIAAMITTLFLLGADIAVAHGGHEHPEESGFDITAVIQVAGSAAALGIAWLVATWYYRRRDGIDGG